MTKEEIIESGLLEQYVLGLTEGEETEKVLSAIKEYPELKEYLDQIERTMETIAQQNAIFPPDDLRERTFKRIAESEQLPMGKNNARLYVDILGGIFFLLLLGGCYYYFNAYQQASEEINLSSNQLSLVTTDCDQKMEELLISTRLLSLYENENFETYILKKNDQDRDKKITVFWDDNNDQAFLYNQSLDSAPEGKTYQIWADIDREMIPLGIFNSDQKIKEIKCLKRATSLNVTIEPEGGSEHPTVENLIMSIQV